MFPLNFLLCFYSAEREGSSRYCTVILHKCNFAVIYYEDFSLLQESNMVIIVSPGGMVATFNGAVEA
jgi:hypothetical protein